MNKSIPFDKIISSFNKLIGREKNDTNVIDIGYICVYLPKVLRGHNLKLPEPTVDVLLKMESDQKICLCGVLGMCTNDCPNCLQIKSTYPQSIWMVWQFQSQPVSALTEVPNLSRPKSDSSKVAAVTDKCNCPQTTVASLFN